MVHKRSAATGMKNHAPCAVIAAKDARKLSLKRDHRAVENAVRAGDEVARDDWVAAVAPDDVGTIFGPVFPRDVRQSLSDDGLGL